MPVLEDDGKQIPQSLAIGRYVAKQHGEKQTSLSPYYKTLSLSSLLRQHPIEGFYAKDALEAAWIDAIVDQFKVSWDSYLRNRDTRSFTFTWVVRKLMNAGLLVRTHALVVRAHGLYWTRRVWWGVVFWSSFFNDMIILRKKLELSTQLPLVTCSSPYSEVAQGENHL